MAVALTGCAASGPTLRGDSFPERARELLIDQSDLGAIALVSTLDTPDAASLAFAAEDGIRGLDVTFDPTLPADSRFRLVVTRASGNPCGTSTTSQSPGLGLSVAFCRGEDAVATTFDESDAPATDAVRRATRQLFPDEYETGSGIGLFGRLGTGISIGVGTSIGF